MVIDSWNMMLSWPRIWTGAISLRYKGTAWVARPAEHHNDALSLQVPPLQGSYPAPH